LSEHRTPSIDFLLKRVSRARDDGDVERARPEWQACITRATVRVRAAVKAFRTVNGDRIAAHDREIVVNDALDRASRRMILTLETLTEPVFIAAMWTCAEHACRDHIRKEGAREKHLAGSLDDSAYEEGDAGRFDDELFREAERRRTAGEDALAAADRLERALSQLANPRQREALQLKRLGYTYPEIADRLGESKDNAYQLVSRGLRNLRRLMMEP
jgi:RNA polymerase sigma factor (sigma-70 family)